MSEAERNMQYPPELDRRRFLSGLAAAGLVATVSPGILFRSSPAAAAEIKASVSKILSRPASHAALRWTGSSDPLLQLRAKAASGIWTAWQEVDSWHDVSADGPRKLSSGLMHINGAAEIEARVLSGEVRDLTIETVSAGTLGVDESKLRVAAEMTAAAIAQPSIIPRSAWGANEALRREAPEFAPISKLIVHHTVTQNSDPNPAATVRGIYEFHVNGNGWSDIGYNFLIDAAGRIYEGRFSGSPIGENGSGAGVVGAHAYGVNTGSCGIALLGTFNNQAPTQAALNALISLLAWKSARHGIDPTGNSPIFNAASNSTVTIPNISGHRDSFQTACPGGQLAATLPAIRSQVARISSNGTAALTAGYWVATRDGQVLPFGAPSYGSMAGTRLNQPIVGMAVTPSLNGYWLVATDGGIFSFGDAQFHGSMGAKRLNEPMVGMASTSSGRGYWTVASDGGIFSFGDARFFGSMGGQRLNKPMVGMAQTPSGNGYWTVASDGGIFCFGDAEFFGSTGALRLSAPITGMTSTPSGLGYWLVASDGGIFCFGDASYNGSVPGLRLGAYDGAAGIARTTDGSGYYVVGRSGDVRAFGRAPHAGQSSLSGPSAAVAVTSWNRR